MQTIDSNSHSGMILLIYRILLMLLCAGPTTDGSLPKQALGELSIAFSSSLSIITTQSLTKHSLNKLSRN
jgi:hypothetical protein